MELIKENNNESKSQNSSNRNSIKTIKITIPSIPDTYTFSRKCYDIDLLSNIILKSEFDKIINKASFVFGDCLSEKRKNDKFEEPFSVKIIRPLSLLFIVLFALIFYVTQNSSGNYATFFVSILFSIGGIGLTIYMSLRNFCRKNRKYYTLQEIIEKNMIEYFKKVNKKLSEEKRNIFFEFSPDDQSIICNVLQDKNVIKNNKNKKNNIDKISLNNSSSFSNKSKSSISEENNEMKNLQLKLNNNESSSYHESKKEDSFSESNKKSGNNNVIHKDYGTENINTDEPMMQNNDLDDEDITTQKKRENTRHRNSKKDSLKHNSRI